ncbi:uncharacterized protein SCHCODRAFT_01146807 [Schizophyllum commune H4-8]|uniref:Expressed protein n=1 Tax=Schizophyllum commune (strain H4-8 / FGSC 9210) TaxID=578458 RepID=D8PTA0_SCHCM|nr:uncharacterized protein SCHCODRAFT_01146807 [Schizophyllum commune H4-8]KAI5899375.1 hypothetical protein SCHCODRAFT_01146807 [Schizophyllum commune H4-8]
MGNVPKASPEVYRSARAGISGMREYGIELLYWQIELLAGMQTAMQLHEGAPLPRDDFQVAYDHHHRHPSSGRFTAVARTGADVIRKSHRLNLCPLSIEGYQALAVEPNFFTPDESVYHRSSWMQVVLKRLERLDIRQTRSPP